MSAAAKENVIQPKQCIIRSSEFQKFTENDWKKKITESTEKQGDLPASFATSLTLKK